MGVQLCWLRPAGTDHRVAVIHMDGHAANAINYALVLALDAALDDACTQGATGTCDDLALLMPWPH